MPHFENFALESSACIVPFPTPCTVCFLSIILTSLIYIIFSIIVEHSRDYNMRENIFAIDEPGENRNRSINIKAQHKTRRAAITQIYF